MNLYAMQRQPILKTLGEYEYAIQDLEYLCRYTGGNLALGGIPHKDRRNAHLW